MRNGRGRRANGANAPTSAQLSMRINNLERRLTGYRSVPQDNPPPFVERPWNTLELNRTDTLVSGFTTTLTSDDVINYVRKIWGLKDDADVRIQLESCSVWMTVGATLMTPDLVAEYFEIAGAGGSDQNVRTTHRDQGTLNKPAHDKWHWPSSDKREVVSSVDSGLKIAQFTGVEAGSNVTIRLRFLWKSSPAPVAK